MRIARVLHLITRLPIGGAERMLVSVLNHLPAQQFESVVCCIKDRGELATEVEGIGVPVISLQLMAGHGFDWNVVPALRKIIRDQRIDLIHCHLYHANLYGRLAANREGIPAIASVHNTYARRKWHRHLINWYLGRRSFCVTAGSEDVRRDLLEVDHLPMEKVVCLPNCIDLNRVKSSLTKAEAKARLGFERTDIVLCAVGRAEEQKGHRILLEAFSQLRLSATNRDRLKLLLVGDGRLLPALRDLAEALQIGAYCRFPGNMRELADVYRGSDIFVMPSLWEGLSLAMLEAMAAGLPVVATDVGGARDVLGDSKFGLLVPPGDSSAIHGSVLRLLKDEQFCAEMALAGQRRVAERYSVSILAQSLSDLYLKALAKGHEHAGPRLK